MDDKNKTSELSVDELLAKLQANMDAEDQKNDVKKKYKFRRSGRITPPVSEDDIKEQMPDNDEYHFESPVPKSDIEDLDLDALMKKYLPEEDYIRLSGKENAAAEKEEFVRTLSSIDIPEEELTEDEADKESFTAPDTELYDHLSEGGKVCDIPELDSERDIKADTVQAPLRPMSDIDRTIAFGSDDEEEGGFVSVREILAAQNAPVSEPKTEVIEIERTTVSDFSKTLEIPTENVSAGSDTVAFDAVEVDDEVESETVTAEDRAQADGNDEISADTVIIDTKSFFESAMDLSLDESVFDDVYGSDLDDRSPEHAEGAVESEDNGLDEIFSEDFAGFDAVLSGKIDSETEDAEESCDAPDVYDTDIEDVEIEQTEDDEALPIDTEDDAVGEALVVAEDESSDEEDVTDPSENAEVDEIDANLMLAFGMDEELDSALGKENADRLREEMDNLIPENDRKRRNESEESVQVKEFVSPTEIKGIFENYKAEYGKTSLKLFALAAVAVLLFFYENIGIFGGRMPDIFNPEYYPIVHIMTGFQFLIIGFAVLYKNVISGFKSLVSKKPTTESFLPVMFGISALYSVLACFFKAGSEVVGFNFPIALSLFLFEAAHRLDIKRRVLTFKIVSSRRHKFALEKLDVVDAELETKAFDKFLPTQPDIFRINKTGFVDGYFRRTETYPSAKGILSALIPASVVAFICGVILGAVLKGSFESAVTIGYSAFTFSIPATIFFTFSLPMFRSATICYNDGSAIVGESALDEYTSASSISFDDREVFPTAGVKLRSIKVFGSGRLDTAIYYMASIYSRIGGPLSDVLKVATADIGCSDDVEVLSIDSDGIETIIDGHHLYAGKADYLRHNGFLPVTDPEDEEIEGGDISIMFLVCDDEVVAKFYVRYRIDPEFETTLKSLYRSGICVGIKTVDPNINDEMLSTRIRITKYPVRVLKYEDLGDRSRGSDRTDSGIVSKKSVKSLLRAFTLCDKTKHVTRTNIMIAVLTLFGGMAITAAVAIMGSIAAVSSVYVAIFQLFWMAPVYLISRFLLM